MAPQTDPFRKTDDAARAMARGLIDGATFAALAVVSEGRPSVTRIALATDADGAPVSLISDLSSHTQALRQDPSCALLIGEPEDRGDPLTHPRITLHARAQIVDRTGAAHAALRERYLRLRPKAKLYIDFGDFHLVRFEVEDALLNGGFGKAYRLTKEDLKPIG